MPCNSYFELHRTCKGALSRLIILLGALTILIFSGCDVLFAAERASAVVDGNFVIWKIGDKRIWPFPIKHQEEVENAVVAFNKAQAAGFSIPSLKITSKDERWFLTIGQISIIEIKKEHSGHLGFHPKTVSYFCLSRLYEAMAAHHSVPLTAKHKLRGNTAISGTVSWYGGPSIAGHKVANGERYDLHHLTAAAKDLPFNTLVRIKVEGTGKTVIVRVTDRFREHKGRILDISAAAAELLGIKSQGVAKVTAEVIGQVGKVGGN